MNKETAGVTPGKPNPGLLALEREAFRDGWRQMMPIAPAVLAWGVVTGMAMVKAGLTVWQALAMTMLVYAGSAQLAALPLMIAGVPVTMIFLTTLVINLRFLIFSALMAPHLAHMPLRQRFLQSYLIADIPMGLFGERFAPHTLGRHAGKLGFSSGVCYCCWLAWQIGSVGGIFLASQIPESWQISFTGTMALIALFIPMIINRAALAGVIVAVVLAVYWIDLPYRLGLLVATIGGMAAAVCVDLLLQTKKGTV